MRDSIQHIGLRFTIRELQPRKSSWIEFTAFRKTEYNIFKIFKHKTKRIYRCL